MRLPHSIIIALFMLTIAHAAESTSGLPSVIGAWNFMPVAGECSDEKFEFLSTGVLSITSPEEAIEGHYVLSEEPLPTGSYKFSFTLTKREGKKGCADQEGEIGQKKELFIRFHVSGDEFLLCDTDGLNKCYGQAKRLREKNSLINCIDAEVIKTKEN